MVLGLPALRPPLVAPSPPSSHLEVAGGLACRRLQLGDLKHEIHLCSPIPLHRPAFPQPSPRQAAASGHTQQLQLLHSKAAAAAPAAAGWRHTNAAHDPKRQRGSGIWGWHAAVAAGWLRQAACPAHAARLSACLLWGPGQRRQLARGWALLLLGLLCLLLPRLSLLLCLLCLLCLLLPAMWRALPALLPKRPSGGNGDGLAGGGRS